MEKDIRNYQNGEGTNPQKRLPVWMLVMTDLLLTCICLIAFMLYHYILPRQLTSEEIVVAAADDGKNATFALPGSDEQEGKSAENDGQTDNTVSSENSGDGENSSVAAVTAAPVPTETPAESDSQVKSAADLDTPIKGRDENGNITNYGNGDTMEIYADQTESANIKSEQKTVTQVNDYKNDHIQLTTNKIESGSGNDKITYYVSDIYVTNVKYLRTAFAYGEYGKNYRESTLDQAKDNNAILAVNGDYYGNNEIGVVIRNGVLYRSDVYDADLCVLFTDGTMKTYAPGDFNLEDIIKQGAWQAWIFGPQLLDGKGSILPQFNSTYYLSLSHPRTAIGYAAPGHYVFTVVDGRNEGYSRGATLSELAQIMVDAGCVTAYNMDGGQSSEMVYQGEFVNQPSRGGRDVSDIVYIGE